jgi:hypothetical protein
VGFVCLANVLQCGVGYWDFVLNVLSLEGERNFALGFHTTFCICEVQGIRSWSCPVAMLNRNMIMKLPNGSLERVMP